MVVEVNIYNNLMCSWFKIIKLLIKNNGHINTMELIFLLNCFIKTLYIVDYKHFTNSHTPC